MSIVVQTKPKLPGLLSLLLVVVLGIVAAKLMWLIITPKQASTNQVQSVSNATIKPKEKTNYGKVIANHHLFGEVAVKKAPVAPTKKEESKVAPTKLNLKLHGIVSYKDSKRGFALISSNGGAQKVYGKGDELQEGVSVSEVFSDKVVLDNHGKSEDLLLPIKESKSARSRISPPLSSPPSNLPGMGSPDNPQSQPSAGVDLSSIRQDALSNPQKLMDIARPSPAIINGKFTGFRVQPGRKRKLFRQLGFRPNDIITEVNGIILDDMSKGAMVYGELSQASDLSVTVKRGSQIITLPSLSF